MLDGFSLNLVFRIHTETIAVSVLFNKMLLLALLCLNTDFDSDTRLITPNFINEENNYIFVNKLIHFGIAEFLDFIHCPTFRKNKAFQELDPFTSSREMAAIHLLNLSIRQSRPVTEIKYY
jgi:hypothetical protein